MTLVTSSARALDSYRHTEVQSRSPLKLVVMLCDGALRFMDSARNAIERRDIPARRDALSRALAIISEMQSTLNMERGGDIAASLDRLYSYATSRLFDAAMHNDTAPVDEVIRIFRTLRDGWASAAAEQREAAS